MALSPIERLLRDVEVQEVAHQRLIDSYDDLADHSRDAGLRFLLRTLRAEAERDRGLLARAASSLRNSILWLRQPDPLPAIASHPAQREVTLSMLEELLHLNREREQGLRAFRTAAHHLYDGLLERVADFTAADAQKHVRMLTYILDRVRCSTTPEEPKHRRNDDDAHLRLIMEEVSFEERLAALV